MVTLFIVLLVFLWLTGIVTIPSFSILHFALFYINAHPVTIWDILLLTVIIWMAGVVPVPFKGLAIILLILWLLAIMGVIAISGFSNLILVLLLLGLILHLLGIYF